MILASACFHLIGLFTLELIALTGALFLFVYLKTQTTVLNKWFSFSAAAILGLVILIMAGTFIGAICMHCCGERKGHGENEGRERGEQRMMLFHHEFGGGMDMPGRHHRGMMQMGGEYNEGMNMEGRCEGMEGCEGMKGCDMKGCEGMNMKDCEKECCKDKKGGHCDMDSKTMIIKKDTLVGKKPGRK
jgi:hypothetical protein